MRWTVTVEYVVYAADESEAEWAAQSGDWEESQVLTVAALEESP